MDMRIETGEGRGLDIAREMMWLAWQACGGPVGMGAFQNRPGATRDDVWKQAIGGRDYPGGIKAADGPGIATGDYVFGRMMKIHFTFDADSVTVPDGAQQPDYQAWCTTYATYDDLAKAAIESLDHPKAEPLPEPKASPDMMRDMAIGQGYVPSTCTLMGLVVMAETQAGRDPCGGCNLDRVECKGRPNTHR